MTSYLNGNLNTMAILFYWHKEHDALENSTITEEFVRNEYKSYILIDFSKVSKKEVIYSMISQI